MVSAQNIELKGDDTLGTLAAPLEKRGAASVPNVIRSPKIKYIFAAYFYSQLANSPQFSLFLPPE